MPVTMESLGIDRLSIEERLELVHEIWESITAENSAMRLSDEQRQELRRRREDADANPHDGVPWEQVEREALARMQKR